MSGVQPGEPVMLADAKREVRAMLKEYALAVPHCEILLPDMDNVLGKLFADTASVVATPLVSHDLPPDRSESRSNDDVVISLTDAIAKQSETIAAQADEIVSLARLVRAPPG